MFINAKKEKKSWKIYKYIFVTCFYAVDNSFYFTWLTIHIVDACCVCFWLMSEGAEKKQYLAKATNQTTNKQTLETKQATYSSSFVHTIVYTLCSTIYV